MCAAGQSPASSSWSRRPAEGLLRTWQLMGIANPKRRNAAQQCQQCEQHEIWWPRVELRTKLTRIVGAVVGTQRLGLGEPSRLQKQMVGDRKEWFFGADMQTSACQAVCGRAT